MKKGTSKSHERKNKTEFGEITSKQHKKQRKLKVKKEELSSDSDKRDYDYAKFLKTYDLDKEDSDSSEDEVTKEPLKTEEYKKENPELPKSDHDFY
ncbi:hypothetical protein A2U01_0005174 [Trifolium medium]|uniref:Uncharacterized protein n=1 Tax=Trifolium medium TaxID=97028 RepID=A0A392MA38_9FABA|nr:hypothetical protein [Trifolium medium]